MPPTREKANQDREALIAYLKKDGTFWERLWLPLIRWVHRRRQKDLDLPHPHQSLSLDDVKTEAELRRRMPAIPDKGPRR